MKQVSLSFILGICFALCGTFTWADESENNAGKTLSPYFFVENGDPEVDRLPLKSTNADVKINGVIADVTVTQTYENSGARPINAKYVFPASTRASVHGMKMFIGDHVITAKIKEKEKAKQTFEKAKSEGKRASLLEQQRPNVFSMDVANIMPGDRVDIELSYTELLIPTDGTHEFVYPTVVGPRYSNQPEASTPESDKWVKSPYLPEGEKSKTSFNITASVSTGIPLQELVCSTHKVSIGWEDKSIAKITLDSGETSGGNRDYILKYRLMGKKIESGLMLYEGKDENFFLLMAQPPERVLPKDIPPREYIFVVDVSGSMNGFPLTNFKDIAFHGKDYREITL
jgi:Ca-activated chloride channel family protein